jgi:hypothetical protein
VLHSGRVDFGEMEVMVFGRRAAEVVAEGARQREAEGVFLMTSGTLNRTSDAVAKVRWALGNRLPACRPDAAVYAAARRAAAPREAGADDNRLECAFLLNTTDLSREAGLLDFPRPAWLARAAA